MRIKTIRAHNFLSFDTNGIDFQDFGDINSFVGPNNAGKTNLFRIASVVGEALKSSSRLGSLLYYHHKQNLNQPFEVELSLELTEEEKIALSDSLVCSHLMDQVPGLPAAGMSAPLANIDPLRIFVLDYYGQSVFSSIFQGDFSIVLTAGKSESYPPKLWFRSGPEGKEVYLRDFGPITTVQDIPRGFGLINPAERMLTDLVERYADFRNYVKGTTGERPSPPQDYVPPSLRDLLFRPSASGPISTPNGFSLNRWSVSQLEQIYSGTEAFQRLRTLYRSKGVLTPNSTVGFFDTIRLIFLSSVIFVSDLRGVAQNSYLENLQSIEFPLYEMTFDRLPEVLFKFKNSELVSERQRIKAISKVFSELTDGLTFNVILRTVTETVANAPALVAFPRVDQGLPSFGDTNESLLGIRSGNTEKVMHELSIEIEKNAVDYPLALSAAGIAEALFLATSIGSVTGSAIFLDEPAQKMHPSLQKKILDYVRESAKTNHNQFFLTTHSPYLITADDTSHIWRFDLRNEVTETQNVAETLHRLGSADQAKIQVSMRSADIRALLFSRGAVLVEGPSDKLVVEKVDDYLASIGKSANLSVKEWSVIEVGSKNSFLIFARLCKSLGLPILIVADNDAQPHLKDTSDNVFLFAKDLEEAMQTESTSRDRKPLRALDLIITQIQNGKLSPELFALGDFLNKHVV